MLNDKEYRQIHEIPRWQFTHDSMKDLFVEIFKDYLMIEIFKGLTWDRQDLNKLMNTKK